MATPPQKRQTDRPADALHTLTFGGRRPTAEERSTSSFAQSEPELDLIKIQHRSRVNAEAVRRAANRRRQADTHHDRPPCNPSTDFGLNTWEDFLIDCSYWSDASSDSTTPGLQLLDNLAGCYEVLAASCELVEEAGERRGRLETVLPLLAEAQSALRDAMARLGGSEDPDQLETFEKIRMLAARHRIFLKRHMRADDRADPSQWLPRLDRIATRLGLSDAVRERQDRLEPLNRLQEAIQQGQGVEENWQALILLITELIEFGVPPSDRAIRELLLPIVEELPEEVDQPPAFRLVVREIDRYLAGTEAPCPSHRIAEPSAVVSEVGQFLAGRTIALIGGDRRPEAQKALITSLGLDQLFWIETREHQPVSTFEPVISRPEVVMVLLAIRWSSHAFGDVKHVCARLGKPLVRLPGGYHPNQVASQILVQCGDRLRERLGDGSKSGT